jgi:8-oxo-dGTP pyrophosphatase MutT (NUDIX family)
VVVRPAATVMLVREPPGGAAGLEVLMVRRNLRSDFVGGAYVFPGGAVDPADGGAEAAACCVGRDDAGASALLGLDSGGLAYWVAVLRECFEEAGVLVATGPDGRVLSLRDPAVEARFLAHRAALNGGGRRFLDICRDEQLLLDVGRVHYFAHWITPRGAPRRYDTRFFVAQAPPDQTPAHDAGEVIADEWITPAEALRRHREGEIELIFPTIRNLQAISRFDRPADLLAAAAAASAHVPAIEPRVLHDGGAGVRIVLPGDPGFDQAAPATSPSDPEVFNDAVRAISREANAVPADPGAADPR